MMTDKEKEREARTEKRIREIFEEEDCHVHVAMHYVIKMKKSSSLKFNKDGTLNRRDNISRIVAGFAEALGIEIKREDGN